MDLGLLVQHYGYVAILVGTFLEGETVLLLGGLAARLGYLQLPGVMVAAFFGAFIADETFFFLGRLNGQTWLARRPDWQRRSRRVMDLLHRHRIPLILGFRFVYGIRAVTPFVIGMSRVPVWQFVTLNFIGAAVWAGLVGELAYVFGGAIKPYLDQIKHYERSVLTVLLILALLFSLFHMYRLWRKR